jgi:hypothetical protein
MRHVPFRECGYAIGFVLLLAAIYVGSYYAMVQKIEFHWGVPFTVDVVSYRFGGVGADSFFGPAHALDQQLRPEFWKREIPLDEASSAAVAVGATLEEARSPSLDFGSE